MAPVGPQHELRALARLYRSGVDGAEDALVQLAVEHAELTGSLLGVDPRRLPTAKPERLARYVADALLTPVPRRAVPNADLGEYVEALVDSVEHRGEGMLAVDAEALRRVAFASSARVLGVGERGGLTVPHLRAVLRALRRTTILGVLVTQRHVVFTYTGTSCRGMLRLVLHPVPPDEDVLAIPLDVAPAIQSEPVDPQEIVLDPRRGPPIRPFLSVLIHAAFDVLRGAT